MKRAMFLLCAAMAWCTAQAQRPALRFDAEGRFKIVQFTICFVAQPTCTSIFRPPTVRARL